MAASATNIHSTAVDVLFETVVSYVIDRRAVILESIYYCIVCSMCKSPDDDTRSLEEICDWCTSEQLGIYGLSVNDVLLQTKTFVINTIEQSNSIRLIILLVFI